MCAEPPRCPNDESNIMTEILRLSGEASDSAVYDRASAALVAGQIVAFPTETVYGIGANASLPKAIERLNNVKKRPSGQLYTLLLADRDDVPQHAAYVPLLARKVTDQFWPGPLTVVLPARHGGTVGLRLPACEPACEIIRRAGVPIAAPSANPSGQTPATTADHVLAYFDGEIDLIIDGGPARLRESSAVIEFSGAGWKMLRSGVIDNETVARVARATILFVCTGNTCRSPMAEVLCKKHLAQLLGVSVEELPARGYRIVSAGTNALLGMTASSEAVSVMHERNCELSQHSSRPLDCELIGEADVIYVMSRAHSDILSRIEPDAAERVHLLDRDEHDIADPVGADVERFGRCADEIELAVTELVKRL